MKMKIVRYKYFLTDDALFHINGYVNFYGC